MITRSRQLGNASFGSRIRFATAEGQERSGTVCAIERRENRHRTIFYRIAEDASIEVDKADVVEMRTPSQIKNDLIGSLIDEAVLNNIQESKREVAKYEAANSPYLKGLHQRPVESIGGIRI